VSSRDWLEWHASYDDPSSSLHHRLRHVQARVRQALDAQRAAPIRVLSMCAGQGRDLLEPLATHPLRSDVRAVLVELDPGNADVAARAARDAGLDAVQVVVADASLTSTYGDVVPVDLALVCGVLGNISDEHVRRTVEHLPRLLRRGGTVVWTRHHREPDLTPQIRSWFAGAGFEEVGFDTEPGYLFSVGTHVLTGPALPFQPDVSLFTFSGDGAESSL